METSVDIPLRIANPKPQSPLMESPSFAVKERSMEIPLRIANLESPTASGTRDIGMESYSLEVKEGLMNIPSSTATPEPQTPTRARGNDRESPSFDLTEASMDIPLRIAIPESAPRTPPRSVKKETGDSSLLTPPPSAGLKRVRFLEHDHENFSLKSPRLASDFYGSALPSPSTPDFIASTTIPDIPIIPFNFTRLPLPIRKRIYALLTTVPALICLRQNRTHTYSEKNAYMYASHRLLLPGISFALTQTHVGNMKSRFYRLNPYANVNILCTNKQIFKEARAVMYNGNTFELANLNLETSPPADFTVPLFPPGYQRLVKKIVMRANAVYVFRYLIKDKGYLALKNYYRGLETLTLVLELGEVEKQYAGKLARAEIECWDGYVKRVKEFLQLEIFDCEGVTRTIPEWVGLRAVFAGDSLVNEKAEEEYKKMLVKNGVREAFEMFKKGDGGRMVVPAAS